MREYWPVPTVRSPLPLAGAATAGEGGLLVPEHVIQVLRLLPSQAHDPGSLSMHAAPMKGLLMHRALNVSHVAPSEQRHLLPPFSHPQRRPLPSTCRSATKVHMPPVGNYLQGRDASR